MISGTVQGYAKPVRKPTLISAIHPTLQQTEPIGGGLFQKLHSHAAMG